MRTRNVRSSSDRYRIAATQRKGSGAYPAVRRNKFGSLAKFATIHRASSAWRHHLAGESPWTWALANALGRYFRDVPIILEGKQSVAQLLRRRIRRLGLFTVAGQVAFGLFAKVLRLRHRQQEEALLIREGLNVTPLRSSVVPIASVNDDR